MNKLKNPTYPSGSNLFKGKGVILTAAAGAGIGFASAKRFLEEGADIVISDAHETRLADATKNLSDLNLGKVASILCDVMTSQRIEATFPKLRSERFLVASANLVSCASEITISAPSSRNRFAEANPIPAPAAAVKITPFPLKRLLPDG